MPTYAESIAVNAPIDVVWTILTHVERMPEWTPTMRAVRITNGTTLQRSSRVSIKQPWLPHSTWTVDLYDPPRYFSWRSRAGLVETVGGHQLQEQGKRTLVTLSIEHKGKIATLIRPLIVGVTRRYVNQELSALKTRAESGPHIERAAQPAPSTPPTRPGRR